MISMNSNCARWIIFVNRPLYTLFPSWIRLRFCCIVYWIGWQHKKCVAMATTSKNWITSPRCDLVNVGQISWYRSLYLCKIFFFLHRHCIAIHCFVLGWFSFSRHWLICQHGDLPSQNDKSRNDPSILSSMS